MDEQEAKVYSDRIVHTADEMIRHQIETMTPAKAIWIIKEASGLIRAVHDPEGENLRIEMQLSLVAQWLAEKEANNG